MPFFMQYGFYQYISNITKDSTMAHDKLQQFLLKKGENPQRSVKQFFIGLVLFLIGTGLLYLGIDLHYSVQVVGLTLISLALLIAAGGYIGIVSNRIAFFRHEAFKNKQRFKNIK